LFASLSVSCAATQAGDVSSSYVSS